MKDMKKLVTQFIQTFAMFGVVYIIFNHLRHIGVQPGHIVLVMLYVSVLIIIVYLKGYADSDVLDKILKK
jgi:hypothetical protein